jgi:hypothetical protein
MHPLDSSLDASLHGRRSRTPRRSSLDNAAIACREDLIGLVSRSSSNSSNWMGQWYHYSSSDEDIYASSADEMDYGYSSGRRNSGPRRLSLNNCTSMNTTFLASTNYTVSTADKSDLDMDWHLEAKVNITNSDDSGSSVPTLNAEENLDDDDDDDDMDSFCDAEGAEPANQEYMRKDLGASCIWNDSSEEGAPPSTVRRGGKKPPRLGTDVPVEVALSNNSHNTTDSQNSNPIQEPPSTEFSDVEQLVHEEEEVCLDATVIVVVNDHHSNSVDEEDIHEDEVGAVEYDDDDECDSFCDAHDHERADRDYLKKDLGASCYWSSNEDLEFCYMAAEDA